MTKPDKPVCGHLLYIIPVFFSRQIFDAVILEERLIRKVLIFSSFCFSPQESRSTGRQITRRYSDLFMSIRFYSVHLTAPFV